MSQISVATSGTGAPGIETITGNTGAVVTPSGGNVNIVGTGAISTSGAGNTLTISAADASTTQKGVVELATNAETIAGADTTRAIVPSALTSKLGSQVLNGVPYGGGSTAAINWMTAGNDGQIIIGATGAAPMFGTLTSSTIDFTAGPNTLNLEVSGEGFAWNEVVVTGPTAMAVENAYITNNAGVVSLLLPAVAALGDAVQIAGKGAGGWSVTQNAGQTIHFNSSDTTTGVTGSISSTNRYNALELVCITANTDWLVISSSGNLTVV